VFLQYSGTLHYLPAIGSSRQGYWRGIGQRESRRVKVVLMSAWLGRRVAKRFDVGGDSTCAVLFEGTVVEIWKDNEDQYNFLIRYEDGDEEDLTADEIQDILLPDHDEVRCTKCQKTTTCMVQWKPCGCRRLCQDCAMQHSIASSSQQQPLQCPTCHQTIAGHEFVTVEAANNKQQQQPSLAAKSTQKKRKKTTTTAAAAPAATTAPPSPLRKRGRPRTKPPKVYKFGPRKKFVDHLKQLQEFKARHGHVQVPSKYAPNQSLANWVHNMRKGHIKLSTEQRQQLDQLGFVWETICDRRDQEWDVQYEKLKLYQQTNGNCRVPYQWKEDAKLSDWVHTQRKAYRSQTIRQDRLQRLQALNFDFWLGKGEIPSLPTAKKIDRRRGKALAAAAAAAGQETTTVETTAAASVAQAVVAPPSEQAPEATETEKQHHEVLQNAVI